MEMAFFVKALLLILLLLLPTAFPRRFHAYGFFYCDFVIFETVNCKPPSVKSYELESFKRSEPYYCYH